MKNWTDDMGEISGFGGGYEAVCRALVLAGIQWCDEHPDAKPEAKSFKNVFGIVTAENDDAKAMEKAMMEAPVYLDGKLLQAKARDDMTGAMHHAAMNHVFAYRRLGWDEYCRQLRSARRRKSK